MYGYESFKSGSKWRFCVKIDDSILDKDVELIKKTILSSTRLGKSKSSEYGLVKIEFLGESKATCSSFENRSVLLYCNSRLALVDAHGASTYELKYLWLKIRVHQASC